MSSQPDLPAAFEPREPAEPPESRGLRDSDEFDETDELRDAEPFEPDDADEPDEPRPARTPFALSGSRDGNGLRDTGSSDAGARGTGLRDTGRDAGPLLPEAVGGGLRRRWLDVQLGFVDDPRTSVEGADALLADIVDELTRTLAERQRELADAWHDGTPDTDVLRLALLRYRPVIDAVLTS